MGLFRGKPGAGAGARFGLRGSSKGNNAKQSSDCESLGSSISPTDQFDIIVPYRTPPGPWKFMSDQRDDDTEVSSMTTDEYRYRQQGQLPGAGSYQAAAASAASSFCCCSAMPTESATATDNTLITSRVPAPSSDVAAIHDIYEAAPGDDNNDTIHNNTGGLEFLNCCGPTDQTMSCPYQRAATPSPKVETRPLNRSDSLFDAITEEEDQDVQGTGNMKRLGKSLRRAIPWKRKQNAE